MQPALRLETTVLPGHRLEVSALELPEGAKVEVIVVLPGLFRAAPDGEWEQTRAAVLEHFLALARSSVFCSAGPYPARDALHERP
jgi:hypothetical protein